MPRFTFGPFSLDPEARVLLRENQPVQVGGKTLDTLLFLVQNRGRLVDKDELLSRIWAGSVVEEANLAQSISTVRKNSGRQPQRPPVHRDSRWPRLSVRCARGRNQR